MCGIAGWVDWQRDLRQDREMAVIERMTATLIPRGPDDQGIWAAEHTLLGHRRLIVLDPMGGTQPMINIHHGQTYVIVYNGEIYNYRELRSKLKSLGHNFVTANSDTEVLLHAYIEWGINCVRYLNGIFAFAVWDGLRQHLLLVRDRLGVKPLFYRAAPNSLLFASEIKSLLAHPEVPAEVDGEGLAEILVLGPARTPGHGIFKGIQEVLPGHCLLFDRNGIRTWPYWRLQSQPHLEDAAATAGKLREMLEDIALRQLQSDVPLGTLLSGGLDSSILTALAARGVKGSPLSTFSVDYRDSLRYFVANQFETNPDGPWIETVSKYLGTDHHSIILDNHDLAGALPQAVQAADIPGMTDIDASLLLFCREIKKDVTVALSGECADEILGGYPWFHNPQTASDSGFAWVRMVEQRSEFLSPAIKKLIRPREYTLDRYHQARSEVPRLQGENSSEARIREAFYLNITRFMPTLLDRKDRMSMACGLEVRVPYSDHRLVEYVWNIPWSLKNYGGMPKGILRHAMRGILPEEVLKRRKSPYPKTHNPIYREMVKAELEQVLNNPAAPLLNLIQPDKLLQLLKSNQPLMDKPWFGQLMGDTQYMAYLLQVNRWLEHYGVELCI
jgi:asparagine synthase (glutamine-hydrolysing)